MVGRQSGGARGELWGWSWRRSAGGSSRSVLSRHSGKRSKAGPVYVAIENQLDWTDHGHLGQLLTYAAGYDARVVVWVTPHFHDEHRAAIDWLNRWTPDEIKFYAVEVRAIKIGDSLPAPEFRPVAFPNGWTKERQLESSGLLPSSQQFRDFFQPVVDELRQRGFTDRTRAYARYYQRLLVSRFKGIEYGACRAGFYYSPNVASVYVSIDTEDKQFNKQRCSMPWNRSLVSSRRRSTPSGCGGRRIGGGSLL